MAKKTVDWKKMFEQAMEIAGEALYLADAYAGGESETAEKLQKKLDKLEAKAGE